MKYQKELNKLGKALIQTIREELLPYLKNNKSSYVADSISQDLSRIFRRLNAQFTGVTVLGFAKTASQQMVERVDRNNKSKFDRSINRATGVDLGSIITTEGLEDFMELSVNKNVNLITSIPKDYLSQIETIVNNGVVSGLRYEEIAKEIAKVTKSKVTGRIKTIARNEVQTINAQLTLRRSESLGITKGIYRTSEDEKVRKCHAELNGKEFVIKKGAWSPSCQKFITPGVTDINCRCTYSPIIEEVVN